MPSYSTHLLLNQLQQQTESFLQLAVSEWQMMPHAQFIEKPAPQSWSANECLQHLNSYGGYYLPAIESAINEVPESGNENAIFKSGWLGNYFTKMMIPSTGKRPSKKMKSPAAHTPTSILDSHIVIAIFIDQQEKLLQLLEEAKQVNMNRARVPISISKFIRLKLGDTFNFLIMHNTRHIMQAQRALGKAFAFEKGAFLFERALVK